MREHVVTILSDSKFGCEPGVYFDGHHGTTFEFLDSFLDEMSEIITGPFRVVNGRGDALGPGNWPTDLADVENMEVVKKGGRFSR